MSKCKITGKVLSIQLGRDETKLVLLGGDSQILYYTTVPTPMGAVEDGMIRDLEAVRGMLKNALKIPELKRVRQAVFTLCTSQVITDVITTPDLPMAKIAKLIQANVDMYFPVDMKEYNLIWKPIGPVKKENGLKEMAIQLWGIPIAMVSGYYTVANACGLSVVAIDYCGNSIATAVGASFARPGKAPKAKKKLDLNAEISFGKKKKKDEDAVAEKTAEVALPTPDTDLHITLERDLLGMTFVQGGQVVMQRFIQCGSDPAYQFGELSMMLEYFRSLDAGRGSFITAIVSGTLSQDIALISDLADMLGMALNDLTVNYPPQLMLCLGASKTTEDFGIPDMNNPGKARKHLETQLWQYALVLAGGVALIVVIMFTLSARLVWNANITSLESTQRSLQIQAQKYAGYADNYKAYSNLYDSYSQDWDLVFNQLRTYNDNLVRVMQELEDTLPKNSSVINLEIAPDGLNVQFACETKEEAAALIMDLREMKYAHLVGISSLQGGGGGAATSYGSGEGEEAPTEGSRALTAKDRKDIINKIVSTTDKDKVWEFRASLNEAQAITIENAYYKDPRTKYDTLEELETACADKLTVQGRIAAIEQMLTDNHYAGYHFMQMLRKEMNEETEQILFPHIEADVTADLDLALAINASQYNNDGPRVINDRLIKIVTKDGDRIAAFEDLMVTDPEMQSWYIYYLEVGMGVTAATDIPYMNMERVVDNLAAGGFNTFDPALDAKMNTLISNEVWGMIAERTESDTAQLPDDFTDEQLYELVKAYYTVGTTGDNDINNMIKAFENKGTSGNTQLNNAIKKYKDDTAPKPDTKPNDPPEDTKPTEPEKDNLMAKVLAGDEDAIAMVLLDYINNGKVTVFEDDAANKMATDAIESYMDTGKTGLGDKTDQMLEKKGDELIKKYIKSDPHTTGYPALDQKIDTVIFKDGSTGNPKLDKFLKDKYKSILGSLGDMDKDAVDKAIQDFLNGAGNNNAGGGGQPQDTRIFFQATLKYSDEMMAAELTRKGLFYDDKVEKVEVAE